MCQFDSHYFHDIMYKSENCTRCGDECSYEPLTSLLCEESIFCTEKCLHNFEDNYNCVPCHGCKKNQFVQECFEYETLKFCSDICLENFEEKLNLFVKSIKNNEERYQAPLVIEINFFTSLRECNEKQRHDISRVSAI